jgi:proteic killer suppression protein
VYGITEKGKVIVSFRSKETEQLWREGQSRKFYSIAKIALRKLLMLNNAHELRDLSAPPSNRLEKLKADRAGQYSIRINDQYRICFHFHEGEAHNVEIVDYH